MDRSWDEYGADDYITSRSISWVKARIKAIMRRMPKIEKESQSSGKVVRGLKLDTDSRRLYCRKD